MLVLAVVLVWLTAGAMFCVALTGLQLRFELASRKTALAAANSVAVSPRAKAS
jgi:hypothetical protein